MGETIITLLVFWVFIKIVRALLVGWSKMTATSALRLSCVKVLILPHIEIIHQITKRI